MGWRAARINDLQVGRLENGVNRRFPGHHLVDQALARLAEEVPGQIYFFGHATSACVATLKLGKQ
jgi:hypothetical protein